MGKTSKYKAKKIVVDGIKFDSIAESEFYERLKYQKNIGAIKDFELQPSFILQDKFNHRQYGNIRAITYKADFKVFTGHNYFIVDVKGQSTPAALLKRKMFLQQFPHIDLMWYAKSKKYSETGWICYFELEKIRKENRRLKKL